MHVGSVHKFSLRVMDKTDAQHSTSLGCLELHCKSHVSYGII